MVDFDKSAKFFNLYIMTLRKFLEIVFLLIMSTNIALVIGMLILLIYSNLQHTQTIYYYTENSVNFFYFNLISAFVFYVLSLIANPK